MYPYDALRAVVRPAPPACALIISQRLVRIGSDQPAVEILLNTSLIADLIKNGEITQIKEEALEQSHLGHRPSSRLCAGYISTA